MIEHIIFMELTLFICGFWVGIIKNPSNNVLAKAIVGGLFLVFWPITLPAVLIIELTS